jgi:hypothetical protein
MSRRPKHPRFGLADTSPLTRWSNFRLNQFGLRNLGGLGGGRDLRSGLRASANCSRTSVRARLTASFGRFALGGQRISPLVAAVGAGWAIVVSCRLTMRSETHRRCRVPSLTRCIPREQSMVTVMPPVRHRRCRAHCNGRTR